MPERREVKSAKTSNANLNSLPKTHRSKYLDLFKLARQKEILIAVNEILRGKLEKNQTRLDVIERQIEELENPPQASNRKVTAVEDISDDHLGESHNLKTMKLGY
ncbi:MAG: hypothetical protein COT43_12250 [Candidatus Marinimicrobia bacterium CG08_land_8_20_14_0_20_45_22]|nr:MAG: hypothetical protein COT43_12250 [Candidatus Marinimicrobia bacterium CG08_land_8_20_14_0_20_45_22]